MALFASPVACSLKQVCSLSPNGAAHAQQSCKKDVSKVAVSLDERDKVFYRRCPCNPCCIVTDSDMEEEYGKLEGDVGVSPNN